MNTDRAIELCNRALSDLGEKGIEAFNAGTVASIVADQRYEGIVEDLLSSARWHFATIQTELSRYTDFAPLFDWAFAYEMPSNPKYLRMVRFARTTDSLNSVETLVWPRARRAVYDIRAIKVTGDVYTHAIFTDYDQAFIEYVGRVDEVLWPPHFDACVVTALAEVFAPAVQGERGREVAELLHQKLHGGRGRAGQLTHAKVIDGHNQPSVPILDDGGLLTGR